MTVSSNGDISLSYTGTTGGSGTGTNAPAITDSWTAANRTSASIFIGRSDRGTASYEFLADSAGRPAGTSIQAIYKPAGAPTTRSDDNQVRYTSGRGGSDVLECGYASNPMFTPNFTDYNARIARAMTAVTATNSKAGSAFSSGVATWDNQNGGRTPAWARLNISTGQLSASSTPTGTYTDFSIANALSIGTAEASYKETSIGGALGFDVFENGTLNKFKFDVNPSTRLNVEPRID